MQREEKKTYQEAYMEILIFDEMPYTVASSPIGGGSNFPFPTSVELDGEES